MAEFCYVMQQWAKMCIAFGSACRCCPLVEGDRDYCVGAWGSQAEAFNWKETELRVMTWAAKNSEQKYPLRKGGEVGMTEQEKREKVIKGLEAILEETADMFYRSTIQDAIALLKAQLLGLASVPIIRSHCGATNEADARRMLGIDPEEDSMTQVLPNLDELINRVKIDKVEITVTIEPERTEITVQPWRPYTPMCPYAAQKEG